MIKFADVTKYGACWTICKDVPKRYLQENFSNYAMVGSAFCRKKCPHFKRTFKFLFWTVVICDLKQKCRIAEPYWYETTNP